MLRPAEDSGIGVLNVSVTILKKINVSFDVHLCLDKCNFDLNFFVLFWV